LSKTIEFNDGSGLKMNLKKMLTIAHQGKTEKDAQKKNGERENEEEIVDVNRCMPGYDERVLGLCRRNAQTSGGASLLSPTHDLRGRPAEHGQKSQR
jgi:hypothetical protein